jgi:hypothetical protein
MPSHITSLASSCILVDVSVTVPTFTKQDRATSRELTDSKHAESDAARVTQHLLGSMASHRKLLNHRQAVYNWKGRITYPWAGSSCILPVTNYPKFMREWQEHVDEFNKLKDEFFAEYRTEVSNRAFKQGDLFNPANYPSLEDIKHRFSINLYTSEVPQGDFRNQISADIAEDCKAHFEKQAQDYVFGILDKQAEQLVEVMTALSKTCVVESSLDAEGKEKVKRKKLYDSTLTRAIELCDTFRSFNLTASPQLEEARSKLADLLQGVTIDTLRESDNLRRHVKKEVDDILKAFKGA